MKRRDFIKFTASSALLLNILTKQAIPLSLFKTDQPIYKDIIEKNQKLFNEYIEAGRKYYKKPTDIGKLISFFGKKFLDTPYVGGTLEGEGNEICRFDLSGVDCFTLTEYLLCLSRLIQKEQYTIENFIEELTFTRYRNGVITDYTSRLHYTSDWIYDNEKKNVLHDISKELKGEKITFSLDFMSKNPNYYSALQTHPEFIEKIQLIEKEIATRTYYYIPKSKISQIEKKLKSGDIICITTNIKGLDYSHIGIIVKKNRQPLFLHSSTKEKKVILDTTISKYAESNQKCIGISVCRAKNVN